MYSLERLSTNGLTPLEPTQEIGILLDQLLEKAVTKPMGIKHRATVLVFLIQRFMVVNVQFAVDYMKNIKCVILSFN
jgi:hypothetical protein